MIHNLSLLKKCVFTLAILLISQCITPYKEKLRARYCRYQTEKFSKDYLLFY